MLEVRRAQADEIAACAALYERVLRETFTWVPPERHQAADFLSHAVEEEVYLARDGERLLGIAGLFRDLHPEKIGGSTETLHLKSCRLADDRIASIRPDHEIGFQNEVAVALACVHADNAFVVPAKRGYFGRH